MREMFCILIWIVLTEVNPSDLFTLLHVYLYLNKKVKMSVRARKIKHIFRHIVSLEEEPAIQ